MAVVIVGNRQDSESYVRTKRKACAELGIKSFDVDLPEQVSEAEVIKQVHELNVDPQVHGLSVIYSYSLILFVPDLNLGRFSIMFRLVYSIFMDWNLDYHEPEICLFTNKF